jgi:hypothetical protein
MDINRPKRPTGDEIEQSQREALREFHANAAKVNARLPGALFRCFERLVRTARESKGSLDGVAPKLAEMLVTTPPEVRDFLAACVLKSLSEACLKMARDIHAAENN